MLRAMPTIFVDPTVVERVTSDEGCVRIEGEIWTERADDEDEVFEASGSTFHACVQKGSG